MHEIFRFVYDTEFREKLQNHLRDSQLEKIEVVPHISETAIFAVFGNQNNRSGRIFGTQTFPMKSLGRLLTLAIDL